MARMVLARAHTRAIAENHHEKAHRVLAPGAARAQVGRHVWSGCACVGRLRTAPEGEAARGVQNARKGSVRACVRDVEAGCKISEWACVARCLHSHHPETHPSARVAVLLGSLAEEMLAAACVREGAHIARVQDSVCTFACVVAEGVCASMAAAPEAEHESVLCSAQEFWCLEVCAHAAGHGQQRQRHTGPDSGPGKSCVCVGVSHTRVSGTCAHATRRLVRTCAEKSGVRVRVRVERVCASQGCLAAGQPAGYQTSAPGACACVRACVAGVGSRHNGSEARFEEILHACRHAG